MNTPTWTPAPPRPHPGPGRRSEGHGDPGPPLLRTGAGGRGQNRPENLSLDDPPEGFAATTSEVVA
jgi:hypothetical protein